MKQKTSRSNKTDNKARILKSAIKLIGAKGVDGTSLADIARDVGISKGTLYYYYSTKNDLVFDITNTHMNLITENIFEIIEKNKANVSWKEMLKILFTSLLKSETRTRLHLYLLREILSGNEILRKRFVTTYRQWVKMIEDGYSLITDDHRNITNEARSLVALIDGFVIQSIIGVGEIQVDKIIGILTKIIDEEGGIIK